MSDEQPREPRPRVGTVGRAPAAQLAALRHTGGLGPVGGSAEPAGVVWADEQGLHVHAPNGRTRGWASAQGPDRVVVTAATPRATVEAPEETSAGAVPWERDFPWKLGRVLFCRDDQVLLDLSLEAWGTGVYAPASPVWDAAAPAEATGVQALAAALGASVEHQAADLPPSPRSAAPVAAHALIDLGLSRLLVAMMALMVAAAIGGLVVWVSGHGGWFFLGDVFALGCVQFAWVAGATWLQVVRWSARRRRGGTVELEPIPGGLVGRGFWRSARVLLWKERFLFRSADGRERAVGLPTDANGVARVVVRDHAQSGDGHPYRVQFCDRNGTVLAELGWDDWFGGPGGADRLRDFCRRWRITWNEHDVLPDDMPARLAPWDARQAGESYPARAHPRVMPTLASASTVVAFWSDGAGLHWQAWPAWAAVGATVLTGFVPWLVRKLWLAARVDPTGSVARSAKGER